MTRELLRVALTVRERHFSPFLMLGDPDPDRSLVLAETAVAHGATMLELGFPFSDPCADGPAIQAACNRALAAGMTVAKGIGLLRRIARAVPVPLNLLVYGNLVHARGLRRFCSEVADAGASSLLVPDIPHEEADSLRAATRAAGLAHVALVGPRTGDARAREIAAGCDGFVYLAGHQGVTGVRRVDAAERDAQVRRAVAAIGVPAGVGFGLATPADVALVHAAGARIAIVGSHLAGVIAEAVAAGRDPAPAFGATCAALAAPLRTSLQNPMVNRCS